MKLTAWILPVLAPLTALSILAQPSNPVPPPAVTSAPPPPVESTPAPETAQPAPKPKAKVKHKAKAKTKAKQSKEAATTKTNLLTILNPPVTAKVKCEVLDVRGQGSFVGEVITHLKKGETVSVLEERTLPHTQPGEPAHWSKIMMPTNTPVWMAAEYIDSDSKVKVKKVNVRAGPGENYSIIARLDKGTDVTPIRKQGSWMEIETPTNAVAFVASQYLEMGAPAETAPTPPPAPSEPVATPAPPPAPVVVNVPPPAPEPAPAPAPAPVATPPPAPAPAPVPPETASTGIAAPAPTAASQTDQELAALRRATPSEPAGIAPNAAPDTGKMEVPRIVTREGYVRRSYNIQTPSGYELRDIKTGVLTEYLQPMPGKNFKAYVGTRVRIVGAETLDNRWPKTPVLVIQSLDLMP